LRQHIIIGVPQSARNTTLEEARQYLASDMLSTVSQHPRTSRRSYKEDDDPLKFESAADLEMKYIEAFEMAPGTRCRRLGKLRTGVLFEPDGMVYMEYRMDSAYTPSYGDKVLSTCTYLSLPFN
jgi:hypothetical protein